MPRLPDSERLVPLDDDPYEENMALVERHGWTQSPNYDDEHYEWCVPDTDTVVRWVVDGDTGVGFFVVEGPEHERVAAQIRDAIPMFEVGQFEDFLDEFQTESERNRGLFKVAAAAPERCHPKVLELFERYLGDDSAMTRRAALIATSITGWPEFIEPVERLSDDPDAKVRSTVESTLRALRRQQSDQG